MTNMVDAQAWASEQFGPCDLKDKRRTQRLVQVAADMLRHPAGSLPEQTTDAADLKAAYRLFHCEDVTFERIAGPHWAQTRQRPPGVYLVLNDTTEVDFEVYCHCQQQQQADWVVRVTQKRRNVVVRDEQTIALGRFLETLPSCGEYEISLRARPARPKRGHKPAAKAQPARTATVQVRFGTLKMPFPKQKGPYLKGLPSSPIAMSVVHAIEINPPKGMEQVEWVLLTSLPVDHFDDAWRILEYYEKRWLIEEFHKALKTGCRIECRKLQSKNGLERITALLSVVAVRLLQLKSAARVHPTCPARNLVPTRWITMLLAARKRSKLTPAMTIREFYREVAKLGGFLGRKSDGEPGWITIWRGWQKLYLLIHGAELAQTINE